MSGHFHGFEPLMLDQAEQLFAALDATAGGRGWVSVLASALTDESARYVDASSQERGQCTLVAVTETRVVIVKVVDGEATVEIVSLSALSGLGAPAQVASTEPDLPGDAVRYRVVHPSWTLHGLPLARRTLTLPLGEGGAPVPRDVVKLLDAYLRKHA